jgi:hypothetical protein
MKRRKIGPGVYVTDTLGTIEMDQWVIDDRKARGLSVPQQRPNTASSPTAPSSPAGDEPGDSRHGGLCPDC